MLQAANSIVPVVLAVCRPIQAVIPIRFQRPWPEVLVQLLPYTLIGLLAALVLVIIVSSILKHLLHRRVLGFVSGPGGMTIGGAALLGVLCILVVSHLLGAREKERRTASICPATQADPQVIGKLVPVAAPNQAVVLGWDFSRRGHDGGPVPLALSLLWTHNEEDVMFLSSPAVVGERVFVGSCQLDVTGKYGSVLCLDARTGRPIWQTTDAGNKPLKPIFSSPAVTPDGQHVVIGPGLHDDTDCSLYDSSLIP